MKKFLLMFVMIFTISITANANETTKLNEVEVENVVHTDFNVEAVSTYVAPAAGPCFEYYYGIFYRNRLRDYGYGNISLVIIVAWGQAESLCAGLREDALGPDYNGVPTWSMQ